MYLTGIETEYCEFYKMAKYYSSNCTLLELKQDMFYLIECISIRSNCTLLELKQSLTNGQLDTVEF